MVDLPSSIMMEDNTFQTCDSPSGSSTSEPHEEANNILSFIEPSFYNKLSQLNSSFMQQNNFVDPLLPSSEPSTNNYWPDMNHVIPELTNNFSNHIGYPRYRMPQVEQTTSLPGMQIRVLGVPQTGAKSRVETQIKLCIQLVTGDGDKAQRWSHLKLPEQMVAKEKLKRMISSKMENTTLLPENMLYLSSRVICASDPTRRVTTCSGCVQRERKRSQRRKENKKVESEEDEKMMTAEEQKILLFNCSEIVDFSSGDAILPTRITCYCRHHNERLGFCIYFEMHDHSGQQVASGMSPPIMITDDHKSNKLKSSRKRPRIESDNSTQRFSLFDSTRPLNYQIQPRPSVENVSFAPSSERPLLQRLIPNEGPTYGGIEVTLLGSGFRSGLTCMFGDVAASSTHYWSPNTLVCILPPAANVGTVVVSFKEYPLVIESQDVTLFTYYNENDRALMELALQVVGLKMTGKVEDAREIAMRIVQGRSTPSSQTTSGQQQNEAGVEHHILQVLQMMTTFHQVDSIDISITNAQGHTLLHFAAMLGFVQLARTLIDLGCNPNVMDNNGYTALHYAAWYQHIDLVDVLLEKGLADPEITNRWNKKPIEMTENKMIHQMICSHHDSSEGYDSDVLSADIDTSFDEEEDEDWLSHHEEEGWMDQDDDSWGPDYLSSSSADDEWTPQHDSKKFIRYLNQVETASTYSPEEIMDAEPLEHIHPPTDTEVEESSPKEMNWMQRTLSHFQPTHSLQNIKNTIPSKPTDLKTIADHILQFPSLFSSSNEPDEAPPDQTLAWYMALAYAMGTKSLVSEDEKEEQEEEVNVNNKRRDRRLYSFWVPMLCFMVIWLIFQFVSSHPNVVDTMISISGFRRQYLSIY